MGGKYCGLENMEGLPEEEGARDEDEILKRRILSHPLYDLLVEAHLECLKVGVGDLESRTVNKQQANIKACRSMLSKTELDHFMEAYCYVLSKLKEAIEEPQQESMAFINHMHSQLMEVTTTNHEPPTEHPLATSSGEDAGDVKGAIEKQLSASLQIN